MLKLSIIYHSWKPQKWRLIYWCKILLFIIFCGFRKVRFQRYRTQFRWNQAVLLLKQWSRLPLTSLKLSFKYHLCKSQKWRLIYWSKDRCSQFYAGSAKYVSNATVHSSDGIKPFFYSNNDHAFFQHRWYFRLNTICGSLRNDELFTGAKDCCSQFFAGSAKYVSDATVHSSDGIKPFFYSNNDHDFL